MPKASLRLASLILLVSVAIGCSSKSDETDSGRDAAEDAAVEMASSDVPAAVDQQPADAGRGDATPVADTAPMDARPDVACTPATCEMFAGSYTGTYRMYTDERLGSSIINMMECANGTASVTIDLAATPVVRGMLACDYAGGLTLFGNRQTATLEASLAPDGRITGRLVHGFDPPDTSLQRTFMFTGMAQGGTVVVNGTGSWLPNAMSAVAWMTMFAVTATK
jgi:hypothetical protein